MTGPEHYVTAEQNAAEALKRYSEDRLDGAEFFLRLAGVHATLAVAAATALNDASEGMPDGIYTAWREVAGPARRKKLPG